MFCLLGFLISQKNQWSMKTRPWKINQSPNFFAKRLLQQKYFHQTVKSMSLSADSSALNWKNGYGLLDICVRSKDTSQVPAEVCLHARCQFLELH